MTRLCRRTFSRPPSLPPSLSARTGVLQTVPGRTASGGAADPFSLSATVAVGNEADAAGVDGETDHSAGRQVIRALQNVRILLVDLMPS